jgi:uncharacterized protein
MNVKFGDVWFRRNWTAVAGGGEPETTRPIVVVTGASEGIGLALARRFAQAGDPVALVARRADELAASAEVIRREFGVDAVPVTLDVTRSDAAVFLEQQLTLAGFHVDVLVNNAGVGHSGSFAEADPDRLERLQALNIAALTRLTRHVLPAMLRRGTGGILNVASLGGLAPGPYQAAYYASKAYVISLTHAIRSECAGQGVRISVLAPGPVETRFHARMGAESAFYRRLLPAPSAEFVARAAYRGFRLRRAMIIPGLAWRVLALAMKLSPPPLVSPIVRWLLKPR